MNNLNKRYTIENPNVAELDNQIHNSLAWKGVPRMFMSEDTIKLISGILFGIVIAFASLKIFNIPQVLKKFDMPVVLHVLFYTLGLFMVVLVVTGYWIIMDFDPELTALTIVRPKSEASVLDKQLRVAYGEEISPVDNSELKAYVNWLNSVQFYNKRKQRLTGFEFNVRDLNLKRAKEPFQIYVAISSYIDLKNSLPTTMAAAFTTVGDDESRGLARAQLRNIIQDRIDQEIFSYEKRREEAFYQKQSESAAIKEEVKKEIDQFNRKTINNIEL